MSYSIDANILLYGSDEESERHQAAVAFLNGRAADPDLLCLTWPALMAYQRIATHPSIFLRPLSPDQAWSNVRALLDLPRTRVITEESSFPVDYAEATSHLPVRGNLVPDAHIATLLKQHGVKRLYSTDRDFRKFDFLEVIDPTS